MSGDEKLAQTGRAVLEYQAAKIDCNHIEKRIEIVFKAYREAGASMPVDGGRASEPEIRNGGLVFASIAGDFSVSNLLNAEALTDLVRERDRARERLDKAKQEMYRLGVTSLA